VRSLPSAVFLDRDGTIIKDVKYISRPEDVELIDGAAEAIARVNSLLVPVVVVTNQSGIGRGYFTLSDYQKVKRRVDELLAERGACIDATYYCPCRPDEGCRCRKPDTLLFERASADLGIDLAEALYIGDHWRDIEAALRFGGRGVLVPDDRTPPDEIERAKRDALIADSLPVALDRYLCSN
jgi:histidinol-phosphate phosphatase family protein